MQRECRKSCHLCRPANPQRSGGGPSPPGDADDWGRSVLLLKDERMVAHYRRRNLPSVLLYYTPWTEVGSTPPCAQLAPADGGRLCPQAGRAARLAFLSAATVSSGKGGANLSPAERLAAADLTYAAMDCTRPKMEAPCRYFGGFDVRSPGHLPVVKCYANGNWSEAAPLSLELTAISRSAPSRAATRPRSSRL